MGASSPQLIAARFNAKGRKTTLIQCYAPTNAATDEEKEDFYSALQAQIDKSPKRDIKIVMGDMNAKVGTENKERELTMGKNGIGIINENGELFADFCAFNDLIIGGGAIFSFKDIHKTTWTSPDGKTKNQIDHITVSRKRRSLMDVRAKLGADAASDHQLVVAILKLKLKSYRDRADKPHFKFNTAYLT